MTLLKELNKQKTYPGRRWIIKYNKDSIKEVKCIYNPEHYAKSKNASPTYGDKKLKEILTKYKDDAKNKENKS